MSAARAALAQPLAELPAVIDVLANDIVRALGLLSVAMHESSVIGYHAGDFEEVRTIIADVRMGLLGSIGDALESAGVIAPVADAAQAAE